MYRVSVAFHGADAQAGGIEITLAQKRPRNARSGGEPSLEGAADIVEDEFALIFDWHAFDRPTEREEWRSNRNGIMPPQTIDDLPTPALILDRAILRRNLKRMSEKLRDAGVILRPHVKTAKSVQIGRMAVEGHDGRITVSTLAEARYFAQGGFKDILYGVGIIPSKLPAVTELRRQGVNLRVITDNLAVARAIAAAASDGDTFSVLIEIDSGGGRAGLPFPALPGLLDIARVLSTHPASSWRES